MTKIEDYRLKIRAEFQACRTLYEVYRISHGLKRVYPTWLVEEEVKRRQLDSIGGCNGN